MASGAFTFMKPWENGDLKLVVCEEGQKEKTLYANQLIMTMWSPVFKAMLKEGSFQESSSKEVKLPGKNYFDVLELLRVLHPPNSAVTRKFSNLYSA